MNIQMSFLIYRSAIFLTLLFYLCGFSRYNQVSVYFKNFVRHSEGDYCEHQPPEATFTAYLNNDPSRILVENAPRWEPGGDPNITGMGVFGVELGNFANPPLMVGDSVFFRFTCNASGQQGILSAYVFAIPWPYFPSTLHLYPRNLPGTPQNVQLSFNGQNQRLISWDSQSGVHYLVYRRALTDTVFNGQSRMLYRRLADDVMGGSFIDTCTAAEAHGYIVIPKKNGTFGSHSAEVVDFPSPPQSVEAAVAYSNPLTVAITWIQPGDTSQFRYRIYRARSPGVPLDSAHFLGESTRFFYLDSLIMADSTYYYRVVTVNGVGIPGPPSEEVSVTAVPFANGQPDLDVRFISRSPKYPRYAIIYDPPGYNPRPRPGTQNWKHYPDPGELITYTAVVVNSGGGTVEGFQLYWEVNGQVVQSEDYGFLFPRQRMESRFLLPWNVPADTIRCWVQPIPAVNEISTLNNQVSIRSDALSFHFHAEENILHLFETHQNPMGSYSFEDWAQVQLAKMNQFFREAVYPPYAPGGVPEWVFLDTVSYYSNGALPAGGTHAPSSIWWDGQWGFTGDPDAINYFKNIVLGQQNGMDWALLHELGHQIGLIDLYNLDVQESEFQVIEPRTGQKPPLTPVAWDVLYYCSRSNYLMHTNFQNGLSDHSAGGLMRNLGKRRGYYGDYLADIPVENTLQIKYPDGTPVSDADIWIFQQQDNIIPNVPKFRGQTDSQGFYTFPHVTDSAYAGGIPVQNPFSTVYSPHPHVVGTNSVLFIRVAKGDSVGYRFTDICDFNVAYWSGDTAGAIFSIKINDWYNMPATGLDEESSNVPDEFALFGNYPNPFNSTTVIRYHLAVKSTVKLVVYDILGRRVRTLVEDNQPAGKYTASWDGLDDQGVPVSSGIYFYRLNANKFSQIRKMLLVQ
ncbi:MAG: hypothetical protein Kow0042_06200 [Calditrichia bacterium]